MATHAPGHDPFQWPLERPGARTTRILGAAATGTDPFHHWANLLYLGARKLLEREEPQEVLVSGRSQLFLKGMLVQLLNPKIAIFFVAFLPQFVQSSRGPIPLQILVLGTVFTLLAVPCSATATARSSP